MEKAEEDAKSCKTLFDKALQAKDAADKELSAKQSAVNASLEQLNEAKASLVNIVQDLSAVSEEKELVTRRNGQRQ